MVFYFGFFKAFKATLLSVPMTNEISFRKQLISPIPVRLSKSNKEEVLLHCMRRWKDCEVSVNTSLAKPALNRSLMIEKWIHLIKYSTNVRFSDLSS